MSNSFETNINEIFKILNDKSDKKVLKASPKQIIDIYNENIKPNEIIKDKKIEKSKKNKKDDDEKIKRPKTAWIYYSMENRQKLQEKNSDKKMTEITTTLSKLWKDLSKEDKQIYEDKASQDKIRYKNEKEHEKI